MPSRLLEHHAARADERTVWWGTRAQLTWMLELLHARGKIAVAGRQSGQRLWDLAERWYPETETVPLADARRLLDEKRFRAQGIKLDRGRSWRTPDATDGPVRPRVTFLSPFDGLVKTATGPRPSGTSSTGSRCTSRRRSASTGTTCSRSCAATG